MHTACAGMGSLTHMEEQTVGMRVGMRRIRVSGALSAPLGGGGWQAESGKVYLQLQGGGEISDNRLEVVRFLSLGVCKREGHRSQGL